MTKILVKVPLYLEVTLEKPADRAQVSSSIRDNLIPHIISFLAKAKFRSDVKDGFFRSIKNSGTISLLDESDILNKMGSSS